MSKIIAFIKASLVWSFLSSSALAAEGQFRQQVPQGQINWTEQYIEVTGSGLPPADKAGTPQGKLLASRAAEADAYRKLLEVVQGVQVDAETTVRDFVVQSDIVRTRVQGVIKGAQRVGSPQLTADGITQVSLRLPLFGNLAGAIGYGEVVSRHQNYSSALPMQFASLSFNSLAQLEAPFTLARCQRLEQPQEVSEPTDETLEAPIEAPADPVEPPPEVPVAPEQAENPDEQPTTSAGDEVTLIANQPEQPFTGLLIDARSLGLTPSMSPMVRSPQAQVYVGKFPLDIDRVIAEGIVIYFSSPQEAVRHPRVGSHPIIVKAVSTDKHRVDFVLKPEDAAQIMAFDQRDHFLEKLQVVALL